MAEISGSTAHQPDLDWSQLKETVLMLNLAIAQIDHSLGEGDSSVNTLASSFTSIVENLNSIKISVDGLKVEDEHDKQIIDIVSSTTDSAADKVRAAIIAFQFYDKLNQRLDHVSKSLDSLAKLISDPNSLYSPPKWKALQEQIRSKYTMEEEKRMFDKVIAGMDVEQVLAEFKIEQQAATEAEDDVELF